MRFSQICHKTQNKGIKCLAFVQDQKGTRFIDYDSLAELFEAVGLLPQLLTEEEVMPELLECTKVTPY